MIYHTDFSLHFVWWAIIYIQIRLCMEFIEQLNKKASSFSNLLATRFSWHACRNANLIFFPLLNYFFHADLFLFLFLRRWIAWIKIGIVVVKESVWLCLMVWKILWLRLQQCKWNNRSISITFPEIYVILFSLWER